MAEPFSIAASIISFGQVLASCQNVYEFACDIKNYDAESKSMLVQFKCENVLFLRWKSLAGIASFEETMGNMNSRYHLNDEERTKLEEKFKNDPSLLNVIKSALERVADLQKTNNLQSTEPTERKKGGIVPKFLKSSGRSVSFAFTKGKKVRDILTVLQQTNNTLYTMFNLYNLIERMREMDVTHQPQEYLQLDIRETRHGNRIEGLSNMKLLSSAEGESSSALGVRSQPGQDRFDFSNRTWDFRHNFADLSQGQAEDHYPLREIFPYDEKHQLLVEWRYMSEHKEIPLTQIRLRKLIAMLQLASNIGEHKFRTLSCLGACLDEAKLHLGIAFAAPIPPDNKENTQVYISLWDKLARDFETGKVASLGYRFRLAEHVCQYVSYLLLVGWLHKGLRSDNILFLLDGKSNAIEDLKGPYLAGFEVSRQNSLGINTENIPERLVKEYATDELNLYRHPEAVIEAGEHFKYPENGPHYKPSYDLRSLGVILLEIAYWRPIDKLEAKAKDWEKFRAHLKGKHTKNLSSRVGDLYLGAVKACMSDWPDSPDERILNFDSEVHAKLKACVA